MLARSLTFLPSFRPKLMYEVFSSESLLPLTSVVGRCSEASAFMYLHHSRMRFLTPLILFTADNDEAFPIAL